MTRHSVINAPGLVEPTDMSWMVRAGDTLYLSGQVAVDSTGAVVGEGDAAAQAERIFDNIALSLAAEDSGLEDIVHLRCYALTKSAYDAYAEAKGKRFAGDAPAGTAVIVAGLLRPSFLLEAEAVAVVGGT